MRAGSLRHSISLRTTTGVADEMGGTVDTAVDYMSCDTWTTLTAYALNDVIKPTTDNGYYYVCTRAGTSGVPEPTFPTTLAQTVNDPDIAGAQWTCTGTGTMSALISPIRAKELVGNSKLELNITHKIIIRYIDGVTSAMDILFNTRTFRIVSLINPDERNVYLEILAEEII